MADLQQLTSRLWDSLSATGRDATNGSFKEIVLDLIDHVHTMDEQLDHERGRVRELEDRMQAVDAWISDHEWSAHR